jgi:hypothetical protein
MTDHTTDSPETLQLRMVLQALALSLSWDPRNEFSRVVHAATQGAGLMAPERPDLAPALVAAQLSFASTQATSEPLAAALLAAARAFAVTWAQEAQAADFRHQLDGYGG